MKGVSQQPGKRGSLRQSGGDEQTGIRHVFH